MELTMELTMAGDNRAAHASPGAWNDAAATDYFDRLPKPTLVVRGDGAIVRSNAAARRMLHERHCLRIAYGRLVGFAGAASEGFETACERAQAGLPAHVVVTVQAPGETQLWHVGLAPASAGAPEVALIVTVNAPLRPERGIVALARLFGLTCAESRVLAHLADDRTPAEIGAALGVSVTTVRSHLQALFQKTGARRQPELVRLALLAASS
jgi:DNA-binding CsgD family transcriptional regulator